MSLFYSFSEDENFYYYKSKHRLLQLIAVFVFLVFYAIVIILAETSSINKDLWFILFAVVIMILFIWSIIGGGIDGILFWFRRTVAFFKNKKIYSERIDFLNAEWKIEK